MFTFNKASMIGLYGQQLIPFVAAAPPDCLYINYYIAGGGGGGGTDCGGGGGGAQVESGNSYNTKLNLNTTYSIFLGAGGAVNSTSGNKTTFTSVVTAYGGAGGGWEANINGKNGNALGGSGGGGGASYSYTDYDTYYGTGGLGGTATYSDSNAGGSGLVDHDLYDLYGDSYSRGGGGGGGAGSGNIGGDAYSGGDFVFGGGGGGSMDITVGDGNEISEYPLGGGGGGNAQLGAAGGGGSGAGNGDSSPGSANTGGGGGGGSDATGTGGSGKVIIWYYGDTPKATGGYIAYDTDGGIPIVIHIFDTSGNFVVAP